MAKNDFDISKAAEEFLASMKIDTSAFDGVLKNASEFNTKLATIAMDAAQKNAELTTAFTAEAMKKVEESAKESPLDYSSVAEALSSEQADVVQNQFAAYAEVAKTAQEKTMELFLAASKEMQDAALKVKK